MSPAKDFMNLLKAVRLSCQLHLYSSFKACRLSAKTAPDSHFCLGWILILSMVKHVFRSCGYIRSESKWANTALCQNLWENCDRRNSLFNRWWKTLNCSSWSPYLLLLFTSRSVFFIHGFHLQKCWFKFFSFFLSLFLCFTSDLLSLFLQWFTPTFIFFSSARRCLDFELHKVNPPQGVNSCQYTKDPAHTVSGSWRDQKQSVWIVTYKCANK